MITLLGIEMINYYTTYVGRLIYKWHILRGKYSKEVPPGTITIEIPLGRLKRNSMGNLLPIFTTEYPIPRFTGKSTRKIYHGILVTRKNEIYWRGHTVEFASKYLLPRFTRKSIAKIYQGIYCRDSLWKIDSTRVYSEIFYPWNLLPRITEKFILPIFVKKCLFSRLTGKSATKIYQEIYYRDSLQKIPFVEVYYEKFCRDLLKRSYYWGLLKNTLIRDLLGNTLSRSTRESIVMILLRKHLLPMFTGKSNVEIYQRIYYRNFDEKMHTTKVYSKIFC